MDTVFIPTESDFKKWVREAVEEYFKNKNPVVTISPQETNLIDRKDAAKLLRISLVTLTDWMKRGLPFYKQRGRVYFIKDEVLEFIQKKGDVRRRDFLQTLPDR